MSQKSGNLEKQESLIKKEDQAEEEHYSSEEFEFSQLSRSKSESEQSEQDSSSEEESENESQHQDDREVEEDVEENQEEQSHELSLDEEGRPKGVAKLFNLIKNDLGEQQSDNFRLFYDLMSNQIKYCLNQYMDTKDDENDNNKDKKEQQSFISPILLLNMIQQQKSLTLNVVDQTSKQSQQTVTEKSSLPSQQIEEFQVKLKFKPRTLKTKDMLVQSNKNHLIQINTKSNKPLKVILDYLSSKFEVNSTQLVVSLEKTKYSHTDQSLLLSEVFKDVPRNDDGAIDVNLAYDILSKQEALVKPRKTSKLSLNDESSEEEMSDGELLEMFTEIFSIIFLKKRKKFLKLKHHDKDACLPHPSSLLVKNPSKQKKRELKRQLKDEQQKLFNQQVIQGGNKEFRMNTSNSNQPHFNMMGGKGTYFKDSGNNTTEQQDIYQSNPYFHLLMKQHKQE